MVDDRNMPSGEYGDEKPFGREEVVITEEELATDRDIPTVATSSTGRIVGAALFLGVAAVAIVFVAMSGMEDAANAPTLTTADNEEFTVTPGTSGAPFITPQATEREDAPDSALQAAATDAADDRPQADPELVRLALEEQQRRGREALDALAERRRSNLLVLDENGSGTFGSASPALALGDAVQGTIGAAQVPSLGQAGPFGGGGNDDTAFASRLSQRSNTVQVANRIENLASTVTEGTLMAAVLETAISTDVPGRVRAIVSEDVYSLAQDRVLIPRGSRLVGDYNSGIIQGQSRVFIVWTRMIRSDGVTIDLDSPATDSLGRSGVAGDVDSRFFARFGSAIVLSLLDGAIQVAAQSVDDGGDDFVIQTGNDASRAAEIALENSIDIRPRITVDQGERVKVFVNSDLDFSSVDPTL